MAYPLNFDEIERLYRAQRTPVNEYLESGTRRSLSTRFGWNGASTTTIRNAIAEGDGILYWDVEHFTDWTAAADALQIPSGLKIIGKDGGRLIGGLPGIQTFVNMKNCTDSIWAVDIDGNAQVAHNWYMVDMAVQNQLLNCQLYDHGSIKTRATVGVNLAGTMGSGTHRIRGVDFQGLLRSSRARDMLINSTPVFDLCTTRKNWEHAFLFISPHLISPKVTRCLFLKHHPDAAHYQALAGQGTLGGRFENVEELGNFYEGPNQAHSQNPVPSIDRPWLNGDADQSSWHYTTGLKRKFMVISNGGESGMIACLDTNDIEDEHWICWGTDLGIGWGSSNPKNLGTFRTASLVSGPATGKSITILYPNENREPLAGDAALVGFTVLDADDCSLDSDCFILGSEKTKWGVISRRSADTVIDPGVEIHRYLVDDILLSDTFTE